jgi:hypothetical protein
MLVVVENSYHHYRHRVGESQSVRIPHTTLFAATPVFLARFFNYPDI